MAAALGLGGHAALAQEAGVAGSACFLADGRQGAINAWGQCGAPSAGSFGTRVAGILAAQPSTSYLIVDNDGAWLPVVTAGTRGVALGYDAEVTGMSSTALGRDTKATGSNSIAIGAGGVRTAQAIGNGSVALGAGALVTGANAVALGAASTADTDNTVSVGNDTTQRRIVNMAAGTVSATSTDAVNGSQLHGTASSIAAAIGGGATVNADGTVSAPSYTVGGTTVHSVGDAFTAVDGRMDDISDQINNGAIGLVRQDATTGAITIGAGSAGSLIDMAGTAGPRVVTGVANGTNDTDAVTIAQLKAVGLVDPIGDPLAAVVYDGIDLSSVTFGGTFGTLLNNVAAGLIEAGSMQAVNGGQLYNMEQSFHARFDSLDGRVKTIEDGIADGSVGGGGGSTPGFGGSGAGSVQIGDGAHAGGGDSVAIGKGASASGDKGTAIGAGSSAAGDQSTAIGAGSSATGDNSVAIGSGSVADRDNTVSVGSEGHERQVTNVAAGTQRTDAANWGQVQDAVNDVRNWADRKFDQVDRRIDRAGAMSAAYGQMAFSAQGINTPNKVGVGVGTQGGHSAIAVGYSRQLAPNLNLSFGGSASGSEVSGGAGLSLGW